MLLNGMEIGGLEGRYTLVCERVAKLLRTNRDAVVATLETFLYDPLATWKQLLPQHKKLERLLRASAQSQAPPLPLLYKQIVPEALYPVTGPVTSETSRCPSCCSKHLTVILQLRQYVSFSTMETAKHSLFERRQQGKQPVPHEVPFSPLRRRFHSYEDLRHNLSPDKLQERDASTDTFGQLADILRNMDALETNLSTRQRVTLES